MGSAEWGMGSAEWGVQNGKSGIRHPEREQGIWGRGGTKVASRTTLPPDPSLTLGVTALS